MSFDDGDAWQPLMLNLPNTSYRDMTIHGNDLVAGTYERGIWILDDISPLRQITPALASAPAFLFKPGDAIRVRRNVNGDTPFPPEVPHAPNPPLGAIIDYYLGTTPSGRITLDVVDASGALVRHLSSEPIPALPDALPPVPDYWLEKPKPMPTAVGTNRINWNIRYDTPPAFTHNYAQVMGAVAGDTPASPEEPLALPGTYTLKLTVDGEIFTQPLVVTNDPRSPATAVALRVQHGLQMKIYAGIKEAWDGYHQIAAMRAAVAAVSRSKPEVTAAAAAFDAKLAAIGGTTGGGRGRGGAGGPGGGTPPPPTFAGLNGSLIRQLDTLDFADMAPNEPMNQTWAAGCAELKATVARWADANGKELAAFNAILVKNSLSPMPAASPVLAMPACPAAAAAPVKR